MTIVVLMQNISSFGPFREKIGSNSQNSGRQLQQNEGRSPNLDKSLFIIGPKEAVSSSGLKKGAPQFQLGTIVQCDPFTFHMASWVQTQVNDTNASA